MTTFWIVIWTILICYGLIGLIVGIVLAAHDMKSMHEPGEELVWIPLGIIAWPLIMAVVLRRALKE